MKSLEQATEIARKWILINKGENCILHEEVTDVKKNGWVFYYSYPEFEQSYSNHPIFIDKHNGSILGINSFLKNEMIKEYEEKQGYC